MNAQQYDMSIHANPDARAWADFFCKTIKELGYSVWTGEGVMSQEELNGWMIGWFSNAMMAMVDAGKIINGDHAQYLLDKAEEQPK